MNVTTESAVDLFPLPDAELVFGVNRSGRHAVDHQMAVDVIGAGLIRDATPWAVCGDMVRLAPKWGAYERGSIYLNQDSRVNCQACAWIVAAARDDMAAEIAAVKPDAGSLPVLTTALGDPLIGVLLLEAIAADANLGGQTTGRFRRTQRADLLALAAQHQPEILVCEECAESFRNTHEGAQCPAQTVACLGCTATAGPWAGEWEHQPLEQCTVPAPCSVLNTLCQHYTIQFAT